MRRLRLIGLLVAGALVSGIPGSAALAQSGDEYDDDPPITVEDILYLSDQGIGDDVILAVLAESDVVFELTAEDVIELQRAGLSDAVIAAMVATADDDAALYGEGARYGDEPGYDYDAEVSYRATDASRSRVNVVVTGLIVLPRVLPEFLVELGFGRCAYGHIHRYGHTYWGPYNLHVYRPVHAARLAYWHGYCQVGSGPWFHYRPVVRWYRHGHAWAHHPPRGPGLYVVFHHGSGHTGHGPGGPGHYGSGQHGPGQHGHVSAPGPRWNPDRKLQKKDVRVGPRAVRSSEKAVKVNRKVLKKASPKPTKKVVRAKQVTRKATRKVSGKAAPPPRVSPRTDRPKSKAGSQGGTRGGKQSGRPTGKRAERGGRR